MKVNYEDKYNEALKWMRSLYDGLHGATKEDAEHYFPELKESEDERIRKEIIDFLSLPHPQFVGKIEHEKWIAWLEKHKHVDVKLHIPDGSTDYDKGYEEAQKYLSERGFDIPWNDGDVFVDERYIMQTVANVLAWGDEHPKQNLEKQSEQILANSAKTCKVEPKFHGGDWIVWKDKCYKVNYNGCGYELVDQNGFSTSLEYGTIDENAHLWDISKDAKDGDVIASGDCIFIFNRIENNWIKVHGTVHKDGSVICENYGLMTTKYSNETFPATKEQRDKLKKAMADAGYEWDVNKKELKKIEQKSIEEISGNIEKISSMWSEEDEKNMKEIDSLIWSYCPIRGVVYDRLHAWLKSLKERIQPQNNWEPSDDQLKAFEQFIRSIGEITFVSPYDSNTKLVYSLFSDLKKLKE